MDPLSLIGGIGSILGGLGGLFGKKKNPADDANRYLSQIPGKMNPYYQPYINAGRGALDTLRSEYGNLLNNPSGVYGKLAQDYEPSKGYQFLLQQALNAGDNASARGGMLGTPQHQQEAMQTAQGLASQDFEKYLHNIMGLYQGGLGGMQGLEQQGYGASTDYGNMLGSVLGQQAQNAYAGRAGMNQANSQNWSNIFGGLGSIFGGRSPQGG